MGVKDVGVNAIKKRVSVIGVEPRVCAVEKDIKEVGVMVLWVLFGIINVY